MPSTSHPSDITGKSRLISSVIITIIAAKTMKLTVVLARPDRVTNPSPAASNTDLISDLNEPDEHTIESDNERIISNIEEPPQLLSESINSDSVASTIVAQPTAEHTSHNEASRAKAIAREVPRPAPTSPPSSTRALSRGGALPIRQSLGIWGCIVIIGGSIGALAGFGFLIFLWAARGSGDDATNAPRVWRAIALHRWMSQAITLAALLIRVIAAAQASVCTAMLASLILEKREVRKSQAAQFSVMRGINDGPLKLLRLLLPSRQTILHAESLLVFALTLSTFSLQFSTTILFSDIYDGTVAGDTIPIRVKHSILNETAHIVISTFQYQAPVNAVYGEVPSNRSSAPDSRGFSDGGLVQRSFLPFDKQQNRTAVRRFEGDGVTMNTRVACMRPEFEGSFVTDILPRVVADLKNYNARINGTLRYGKSLRDAHSNSTLCNSEGCQSARFDCGLPEGIDESSGYQSAFCSVASAGGEYWNGTGDIGWETSDEPWTSHSMVQLVYLNNIASANWPLVVVPLKLADAPRIDYEEWSSFELLPGKFLNITLCFSAFTSACNIWTWSRMVRYTSRLGTGR